MVDQVVDRLQLRGRLIMLFSLLRGVPGSAENTQPALPPMAEDEPVASFDQA